MRTEKKKLLISIIIIFSGSILTILSSSLYFTSVSQEDMLYDDIPFQRGMSFTTWGAYSFNSTEAKVEILEMKEIGIEWVGVNIWWFQKNVSSTTIYPKDWTDTAPNITSLFDYIHAQGMKVLFKPMIDSEDQIWRSYIEASPEWITSYANFIKYTAEIAENGSVEVFSIGCEMGNWQVHEADVVALIAEVRQIYSGKLTYAANHDSFWYINFWDKLDIIGVDAYFSFTLSYNPSLQDMIDVWDGFYDDLTIFQRKWNKPIFFIELGCQNRNGCNIAPNDNKFNLNQDEEEFQMYYKSLFQSSIWTAPWFKGTYWWMWDCRVIDELTDIGFSPQLPIIKSTIHNYYSGDRNIVYPNFWINFILILVLGGLTTCMSTFAFRKLSSDIGDESEQDENRSSDLKNPIFDFILISGIILGLFIFWAFTYYNQILFNVLYSAVTKSIFLGEGVLIIILFILISIVVMIFTWIILQRLIYFKPNHRLQFIIGTSMICSTLIFILEALFANTFTNEVSISFFLILQVMIILGILFSIVFYYGFPRHAFKDLEKTEKKTLLVKIVFGILGISTLFLVGLSYTLQILTRAPSLIIGITLLLLIPIMIKFIHSKEINDGKGVEIKRISLREKLKPNQMKLIEGFFCLFAFSYYLGILRFYDIHTLINFNLTLLPNFFVPIGFSILIAIPMVLGLYVIIKTKYPSIERKLDLVENSKNEIMLFLMKISIYFSFIILISCWFFTQISYEIALILGGIPLVMIFVIYLIGNTSSTEIFNQNTSWKRLTIYLILALTVAFTANGVMVGLLYLLTFLTVENGQIVVRTAFGEELGFDAIQLIYIIQLLTSIIPLLLCQLCLKFIKPKIIR